MKNKDVEVLHKIIIYCDDIDLLKEKYDYSFQQ